MRTDCGATTTPSYGVRIIVGTDTTDNGIRDNTVCGSNGGVKFKWLSNDTLFISGVDTTSGFTRETRVLNVAIVYAEDSH